MQKVKMQTNVKKLLFISILVVLCFVGGAASYSYFGLDKDNPFEQFFEFVIKQLTGQSVDISGE